PRAHCVDPLINWIQSCASAAYCRRNRHSCGSVPRISHRIIYPVVRLLGERQPVEAADDVYLAADIVVDGTREVNPVAGIRIIRPSVPSVGGDIISLRGGSYSEGFVETAKHVELVHVRRIHAARGITWAYHIGLRSPRVRTWVVSVSQVRRTALVQEPARDVNQRAIAANAWRFNDSTPEIGDEIPRAKLTRTGAAAVFVRPEIVQCWIIVGVAKNDNVRSSGQSCK